MTYNPTLEPAAVEDIGGARRQGTDDGGVDKSVATDRRRWL